jgi:HAD superfamily hydrolase (TIGR01509 family)
MQIKGVIFDMDGVLIDSEAFICQAAREMFRQRYDTDVPPEDFLPFVGAGETKYIGGPAEKHGLPVTLPDDKIRTYEIYLDLIKDKLGPLPGADTFIRHLQARGVKVAVASAADRMKVDGNLQAIGFTEADFQAVITGSDVDRHKPDPQCFLMAMQRMNLSPEVCCVVEDAVNGCKAARAAGMHCLGITSSFDAETLRNAGAHWTAPDLAHVPNALQARLAGEPR